MSGPNDWTKVIIKSTPQGLRRIQLDPWPDQKTVHKIQFFFQGECYFREALQNDLLAYFSGQPVSFAKYPFDRQDITPFVQKVLAAALVIPWGETKTYGWLARQSESGARAVGGALGRNPWPVVIPCHRIVRKDGELGGFSAGISWKRFLLGLESKSAVNRPLVEFLS